jgi:hypothetical protein
MSTFTRRRGGLKMRWCVISERRRLPRNLAGRTCMIGTATSGCAMGFCRIKDALGIRLN